MLQLVELRDLPGVWNRELVDRAALVCQALGDAAQASRELSFAAHTVTV